MIIWYKNSFLASIVSIIGCICCVSAIFGCVEGDPDALILVLPGIPLMIWGKVISENKRFKKWWKQITDKNLEPQIAASVQTAIAVYNKNPQKRTLKKIEELNPAAAANIRDQLARKKAAKK